MARPRTLRPEDLPIPEDARPHKTWPPMMLEMAAHIGAYDTLRLVDAFAGQVVYVPLDASRSPFAEIVGSEKAAILSHVYGREKLQVATGRGPLLRARRQGVIAAVRAKKMSVRDAAAMLRMARRHLHSLIKQTDEGTDAEPVMLLPPIRDPRQLDMFGEIFDTDINKAKEPVAR